MNNPFKIIGTSLVLSVIGIFGLFELPQMLHQFEQSEWLAAMGFALLLSISVLVSLFNNTQKLRETIRVKSNH